MSNNAYKVLMERSWRTHEHFHKLFFEYFHRCGGREKEPANVTEARKIFFNANDELWNKLLYPLQSKFHADSETAIDEVIDFLEVDIPAFRCGYLKEHFLERLKAVKLSDGHKIRLRKIALELCKNDTVRREFRRWVNLMRQLADHDFIVELRKQITCDSEPRATNLMLQGVLGTRKELAN